MILFCYVLQFGVLVFITILLCYSQKPGAFNTKCVQLIGKCFRDLEKLSIGGYDVDLSSLVFIGKHLHLSLSSLIYYAQ